MTNQTERTIDLEILYKEPPVLALEQVNAACYTICLLRIARDTIVRTKPFDVEAIQDAFLGASVWYGVTLKTMMHPVAVAVTGKSASETVFALMASAGKDEALLRVENAYHSLRRSLEKSAILYQGQIEDESTLSAMATILSH